ncbi:hypothetical protein B0H14DRAFT_3458325 [Mycena olivaceomarginata]|nr:hypothetical protein B0H14DRAFT_3504800 [Mycena olivaceomarginata]KAJ7840070.1 hypothetical protein B0H14DRAFT_3458325 [Mycena olivaceomarginata]
MKYLVSIAIATLIYAGVLVGGLSVERKSTSSPGTMKGYLQLRGAGESGTHHGAGSASNVQLKMRE